MNDLYITCNIQQQIFLSYNFKDTVWVWLTYCPLRPPHRPHSNTPRTSTWQPLVQAKLFPLLLQTLKSREREKREETEGKKGGRGERGGRGSEGEKGWREKRRGRESESGGREEGEKGGEGKEGGSGEGIRWRRETQRRESNTIMERGRWRESTRDQGYFGRGRVMSCVIRTAQCVNHLKRYGLLHPTITYRTIRVIKSVLR